MLLKTQKIQVESSNADFAAPVMAVSSHIYPCNALSDTVRSVTVGTSGLLKNLVPAINIPIQKGSCFIYKSLFTIQYGRNDNEKKTNKKTFTANYYTL